MDLLKAMKMIDQSIGIFQRIFTDLRISLNIIQIKTDFSISKCLVTLLF